MEEATQIGMKLENRIISVDILKGIAIIGVLILHPILYDNFHTPSNAQQIVSPIAFVLLLPLLILATWAGGFTMLSSAVSTYNIYGRMKKKHTFKEASAPILWSGLYLLILDPIKTYCFDRTYFSSFSEEGISYSILSRLLQKGELAFPGADKLMQIGILPAIAFSGFLTVFLLWVLFRNNGKEKIKRNIIILAIIGFSWAIFYYPISVRLSPYVLQLFEKGGFFIFLALILRLFVSHQLSFFLMGIYAIFGMICGILLSQNQKFKIIKKISLIISVIFLTAFAISITILISTAEYGAMNAIYTLMDYELYPKELLFLSLGLMFLLIIPIVKKIEFRSAEKRAKIAKKTMFLKKFGNITLSLYVFEPVINGTLGTVFHLLFNGGVLYPFGSPDPYMTNDFAVLLFGFTFVTFWILFVHFWSKTNYKYGLEYLIIIITNPYRREKSRKLYSQSYQ